MSKPPKKKSCRTCKEKFIPFSSLATACSPKCAIEQAKVAEEKKIKKDHKERKERLKNKSDYLKEAQTAFNAYVRERDKGQPCISCGKYEGELKIKHFITMVCGHFLSVGAHGELRFHPFNANLQCTRCNGGAGKYGNFNNKELTVTKSYRINLVDKIGLENVEWLESQYQPQNLTIEDVKEIKIYYREQLKAIKQG